jgi:hypothetical protein
MTIYRRAVPPPTDLPPVPPSLRAPVYDEQRVERDTDYDIEFRGLLLASHRYSADGDRYTEVDLFRTEGGQFVAAARFGSLSRPTQKHVAAVCASPEEVVAWMRESGGGKLGTVSKAVLQQAHSRHPDLFPLRPVEVVP